MFETSWLELSKSALQRNINFIKKMIGPGVTFSSVVKGNAYGHSIEQFIPLAEKCGQRHFSVFSANEAYRVYRAITENSQVMIMGMIDDPALEWVISKDITFYVFDMGRLRAAIERAKLLRRPARIHLELETGMNRTGFNETFLEEAIELIKQNREHLVIEGVCTHFAGAESVGNYLRVQRQMDVYKKRCDWLAAEGVPLGKRHTASSAATFIYPEVRYEMVRVGIAHYGFWPSLETRMHYELEHSEEKRALDPLKRVLSWKSRVMVLRDVNKGEFVNYGISHMTARNARLAIVPVGYVNGFPRTLSNLGQVLIRGKRAPVVGPVNMNMITLDVSHIRDVQLGDEVVIIGKQKGQEITVSWFSDQVKNVNYEVLVRLPDSIPRKVVR